MSDQTTTLPTIPPEQIAAMRANWHALGLPIDQFDNATAEHGTPLPPAAPSADPTLPPDQLAEARAYWIDIPIRLVQERQPMVASSQIGKQRKNESAYRRKSESNDCN